MRRLCFVIAAIFCASAIRADLKEDFNSLTSGSWTTETAVELPSGTWMFGGGLQYNKSNNVVSLKFNQTEAYLITPVLDSVTSVEFKHRSGGSKKQIDVAYRIGSGEWAQLIADFPFLASPASGKAHDLGPYELKQETPAATDEISNLQSPISNKILRNGQLLILHGDKAYTITGLEIRK